MTDHLANHGELMRDLAVIVRRGRRISARAMRAVDPRLDASAFPLLGYLLRNPGTKLSDLAQAQCVSKGTMSRQVARLESFGLIERHVDPNDSRSILLSLTPKARELSITVRHEQAALMAGAMADWPAEDVATLQSLLHRFAAVLAD